MKEVVKSSKAPEPIGPYSQAIRSGNMVFFSGQIAIDPASGKLITHNIESETKQVMKNIEALLGELKLGFEHVVKSSIFLKDMGDFPKVNDVYGSYFSENFPARETVQVSRLPKDVNVEISIIAAID